MECNSARFSKPLVCSEILNTSRKSLNFGIAFAENICMYKMLVFSLIELLTSNICVPAEIYCIKNAHYNVKYILKFSQIVRIF